MALPLFGVPKMNVIENNPVLDRLLTVHEVAKLLGISTRQIWKLVKLGQVPAPLKLARSARWRQTEVLSFIANGLKLIKPD